MAIIYSLFTGGQQCRGGIYCLQPNAPKSWRYRPRTSGLNLVVASIVLWNTVYLERAVTAFRRNGQTVSDEMLTHLSPLKREYINLTGDYHWRKDAGLGNRKLPPPQNQPPASQRHSLTCNF